MLGRMQIPFKGLPLRKWTAVLQGDDLLCLGPFAEWPMLQESFARTLIRQRRRPSQSEHGQNFRIPTQMMHPGLGPAGTWVSYCHSLIAQCQNRCSSRWQSRVSTESGSLSKESRCQESIYCAVIWLSPRPCPHRGPSPHQGGSPRPPGRQSA